VEGDRPPREKPLRGKGMTGTTDGGGRSGQRERERCVGGRSGHREIEREGLRAA
jgi:hypothetical protein